MVNRCQPILDPQEAAHIARVAVRVPAGHDRVADLLIDQVVGVIDDWQPMPRFYHADWSRAFEDAEQVYVPMNRAIDAQFGPRGNTNCWKAPDENLPLFEQILETVTFPPSQCVL